MRLWIVRHGQAENFAASDALRPLTGKGRKQAEATGSWLAEQGARGARVLASPYLRAQQTATIIAAALGAAVETLDCITPDDNPRRAVAWLADQPDEVIVLVSHMPLVGRLLSWLEQGVDGDAAFATAQAVALDMEIAGAGVASRGAGFSPH